VQNEEQLVPTTLWQRISKTTSADPFKPIDRLYVEYDRDKFAGIVVNKVDEPEVYEFVESIKSGSRKYNDYPQDQIDYFARRIYELRKHNTNNTAG
jgi:hypothetical protein